MVGRGEFDLSSLSEELDGRGLRIDGAESSLISRLRADGVVLMPWDRGAGASRANDDCGSYCGSCPGCHMCGDGSTDVGSKKQDMAVRVWAHTLMTCARFGRFRTVSSESLGRQCGK